MRREPRKRCCLLAAGDVKAARCELLTSSCRPGGVLCRLDRPYCHDASVAPRLHIMPLPLLRPLPPSCTATSAIPEELPQEHPTALWGRLPWPLGLVARLAVQLGVGALAAALAGVEVAAALLLPAGWVRKAGPVEPLEAPGQVQGREEVHGA